MKPNKRFREYRKRYRTDYENYILNHYKINVDNNPKSWTNIDKFYYLDDVPGLEKAAKDNARSNLNNIKLSRIKSRNKLIGLAGLGLLGTAGTVYGLNYYGRKKKKR